MRRQREEYARNIAFLSGGVTDTATKIAIRQLEERILELIRHTHGIVTTSADGFAPELPGDATLYLDGEGNYTTPLGGGVPLTDGDKGDITVTGSGATWTIDANTVTNSKLRDSSALSVIGRSANSVGDPADITSSTDGHVLRQASSTLGFGTVPYTTTSDFDERVLWLIEWGG